MDDLKIYVSGRERLRLAPKIFGKYMRKFEMEFGLDKCDKDALKKRGRLAGISEDPVLVVGDAIRHLGMEGTCQYLSVPENRTQDVVFTKEEF